jgi:TIR domain
VSEDIDFFVSYTAADARWAEWIAWTLEKDGGYTVLFQGWDFRPGNNFALMMQDGAALARRTIAVLTPAYLQATFTEPEWSAAFAQDPRGTKRQLIPVMVEQCESPGLFKAIVPIRLAGLDQPHARDALLKGVGDAGGRPLTPPAFPGPVPSLAAAPFPGGEKAQQGRSERPADRTARPAPPACTWIPLADSLPVSWEPGPPVPRHAGATSLELHLIPASPEIPASPKQNPAVMGLAALSGELAKAGRRHAVFLPTQTVNITGDASCLTADLADPGTSGGLRIYASGQRSGWLTTHQPDRTGLPPDLGPGIGRLLAALTDIPLALPPWVAFGAGIDRRVRLLPRERIPSRHLTTQRHHITERLTTHLLALLGACQPTDPPNLEGAEPGRD